MGELKKKVEEIVRTDIELITFSPALRHVFSILDIQKPIVASICPRANLSPCCIMELLIWNSFRKS